MAKVDVRKAQGKRLALARKAAGYRSAREAALANGWVEGTYRTHEAGTRTMGVDDADKYARRFRLAGADTSARQILFGEGDEAPGFADSAAEWISPEAQIKLGQHAIPIMGYIGAGAVVDPDYEQVPPDGLDQVELPFVLDDDVIGLQVKGDSMKPIYNDGDVVIVRAEQHRPIESLIGNEAAVRTYDGKRFLKHILPGSKRHTYHLLSHNADAMMDVRLAWGSEVLAIVPARQTRHIARARTALRKTMRRGTTDRKKS